MEGRGAEQKMDRENRNLGLISRDSQIGGEPILSGTGEPCALLQMRCEKSCFYTSHVTLCPKNCLWFHSILQDVDVLPVFGCQMKRNVERMCS